MTLAMTDEMKNCNPKPLQLLPEGNQTILPQQTTTVAAIVFTANTNDVTGAVQPLQEFDETANIIVVPALATVHKNESTLEYPTELNRVPQHYQKPNQTSRTPNSQASGHKRNATYRRRCTYVLRRPI